MSIQASDFDDKVYIETKWIKMPVQSEFIKKINLSKVKVHVKNDKGFITHIGYSFNKKNYIEFNKIFDTVDFNKLGLTVVLNLVLQAHSHFNEYRLSEKTAKYIKSTIKSINKNSNLWENLTNRPDYNHTILSKRIFPFKNHESKEWVKVNTDSVLKDYPDQIFGLKKTSVIAHDDDYALEANEMIKDNNFLAMTVVNPADYPNMKLAIANLTMLSELDMRESTLMLAVKYMLSVDYCHIIKCKQFYEIIEKFMPVKSEIFAYYYYYAMYLLRQEETIMFSHAVPEYRVLFTLEEASILPELNMPASRNPYLIQLPRANLLEHCIPFYLQGGRSINGPDVFQHRFKLATGGIFEGIDLKKLNAAITGSILVPCAHKNPLEENFRGLNWDRSRAFPITHRYAIDEPDQADIDFLNYLEYCYPSYVSLTDDDYMKDVLQESTIGDKPKLVYEDDAPEGKFEKLDDCDKSVPKVDYNQLADIDISITTHDFEIFRETVQLLFKAIQANTAHRGPVYMKEIKTITQFKYKIYGPGVPRPIDVFRIGYHPARMVKKFHLHCVKMYYDGQLMIFRSCIASLLSGVNESYKWFSCNKTAGDVLLKYIQRGISIVLNEVERDVLVNYIKITDRWNVSTGKTIYGPVQRTHRFFAPDGYDAGIRKTLRRFAISCTDTNFLKASYDSSIKPYGDLQIAAGDRFLPPNLRLLDDWLEHDC